MPALRPGVRCSARPGSWAGTTSPVPACKRKVPAHRTVPGGRWGRGVLSGQRERLREEATDMTARARGTRKSQGADRAEERALLERLSRGLSEDGSRSTRSSRGGGTPPSSRRTAERTSRRTGSSRSPWSLIGFAGSRSTRRGPSSRKPCVRSCASRPGRPGTRGGHCSSPIPPCGTGASGLPGYSVSSRVGGRSPRDSARTSWPARWNSRSPSAGAGRTATLPWRRSGGSRHLGSQACATGFLPIVWLAITRKQLPL